MIIYPLSKIYSDNLKHPYPVSGVGGSKPIDPTELEKLLHFTAIDSDSTMTFNLPNNVYITNNQIKYSFNGTNWSNLTLNTNSSASITIPQGQTVYLKAAGITGNMNYGSLHIDHDANVTCGGDITSLLNEKGGDVSISSYTFYQSFKGNTHLKTIPNLPSSDVNDFAFCETFSGCTGLEENLEISLPMTNSNGYRFYSALYGCSTLKTVRIIFSQGIQAGLSDFEDMFRNCSLLTDVSVNITGSWNQQAFKNWLNGVYSSGILHNLGGATNIPNGVSGYPSGWTLSAS